MYFQPYVSNYRGQTMLVRQICPDASTPYLYITAVTGGGSFLWVEETTGL
jgi:hypothetical protein